MLIGTEFLKRQVQTAVDLHTALHRALDDHAAEAEDPRYRELCYRHAPQLRVHTQLLDDYLHQLGAADGVVKKAAASAMNVARQLADSVRESDYVRLVADIALARQCEDACKTFREGGRALANAQLQSIGDAGERQHDNYVHDANRLLHTMFVEHVHGVTASDIASRATLGQYRD